MANHPFVTDMQTLRARARHHIEQGAVTEGYRADRETVIRLLQEALATELVCVLRYKRHHFMASGIHAQSVGQEFLQHATEEQLHADQLAQRIVQLGRAEFFAGGVADAEPLRIRGRRVIAGHDSKTWSRSASPLRVIAR